MREKSFMIFRDAKSESFRFGFKHFILLHVPCNKNLEYLDPWQKFRRIVSILILEKTIILQFH